MSYTCSLCYSEGATAGCLCYNSLTLIGSNCLSKHVTQDRPPHHIISLTAALKVPYLQSDPMCPFISLLTSPCSPHFHCPNLAKTSYSSLSSPLPSNIQKYSRYLYYLDLEKTIIYRYDTTSKSIQQVSITNAPLEFISYSSLAKLPYGNFYLSCGNTRSDFSHSGIVMANSRRFMQFPSELESLNLRGLAYNDGYLYAFGGSKLNFISNQAIRCDLSTNRIVRLPNMRYARKKLSPVVIGHKILLFHGGSKTIESFNTLTLKYEEIAIDNVESSKFSGIAFNLDDKIFLVTKYYTQVYDTHLNKLGQIPKTVYINQYTDQTLTENNKSYYINKQINRLEKVDPKCIDQKKYSIDYYRSQSNARFSYIWICNPILYRVDLKYKTIENMELGQEMEDCRYEFLTVLPNGIILLVSSDDFMLYDLYSSTIKKVPKPLQIFRFCIIYHDESLYWFGGSLVMRFDLDTKVWSKMLDIQPESFHSSKSVTLASKIYILEDSITHIYDAECNSYSSRNIILSGKNIVAGVNNRIYELFREEFRVYNEDLEIIDRGKMSESGFKVKSDSLTGIYKDRIYYSNSNQSFLEYFDVKTYQRGAEAFQYI